MTDREFLDLAAKCLDGTATPEEEAAVVSAAETSDRWARWLAGEAVFDAALRALAHRPDPFVRKALRTLRHDASTDRFARRMRHEIEAIRRCGGSCGGRAAASSGRLDASPRRIPARRLAIAAAVLTAALAFGYWTRFRRAGDAPAVPSIAGPAERDAGGARDESKRPDRSGDRTPARRDASEGQALAVSPTPVSPEWPAARRDDPNPGRDVPGTAGPDSPPGRESRGPGPEAKGSDGQAPLLQVTREALAATPEPVKPDAGETAHDRRPDAPPDIAPRMRDATSAMTAARPPVPGSALARMESVSRHVLVYRGADPATAVEAETGTELRDRDAILVPTRGNASIRYTDRTILSAEGHTRVEFSAAAVEDPSLPYTRGGGGARVKRVALIHGTLNADVPRDPQTDPILITTPNARVRAAGSQLTVTALAGSTRLEVRSGRGALTRNEDGGSVDVPAGQHAVAAQAVPLVAAPIPKRKGLLDVSPPELSKSHIDLAEEGALDWMCWTQTGKVGPVRKGGMPRYLGDVMILGRGKTAPFVGGTRFSWTHGDPIANGIHSTGGITVTGVNAGLQLTAPAGKTPRTLRIYVAISDVLGRLEAVLSDGSVPPVVEQVPDDPSPKLTARVFTIRYAALAERQVMTVGLLRTVDPADAARRDRREDRRPDRREDRKDGDRLVLQAISLY
jgi:hypothetical protein